MIDDGLPRLDVSVRQHGFTSSFPFPGALVRRIGGAADAAAARLLSRPPNRDYGSGTTRDGDGVHSPPHPARRGVRLHGRALGIRRCACRHARAGTGAAGPRGRRLHWRPDPYESKRHSHRTCTRFRAVWTSIISPRPGEEPYPADQAHIPHPRLGFFGVVDERMDLACCAAVSGAPGLAPGDRGTGCQD